MDSEQSVMQNSLPEAPEKVKFPKMPNRHWRKFVVFLLCASLFVAAFAGGCIFWQEGGRLPFFRNEEEPPADSPEDPVSQNTDAAPETPEAKIPDGAIMIVEKGYAGGGVENLSKYVLDLENLQSREVSPEAYDAGKPLVLILSFHTGEAYRKEGENYLETPIGDSVYADDPSRNMLAVARTLSEKLNAGGIPTILSEVRYDQPTLLGASGRAENAIREYLKIYPSIQYVIDLGRENTMTESGECIAATVEKDGVKYAQIRPVVGSNGNGESCDNWEDNLSLALRLQNQLNQSTEQICRSVLLENSPYGQGISKGAMTFRIGTSGNTASEAMRSAELLASAICEVFKQQ